MISKFLSFSLRTKVILTYLFLSLFYTFLIGIIFKDAFALFSPILQFAVCSIPIFGLFSIIIGGIDKPKRILGSFILFVTSDIIGVPFMINPDGSFGQAFLSGGASDTFVATIAQSFGVNGFPLYLFTYIIIPTVLVIVAVYLLKNKDLKDAIN